MLYIFFIVFNLCDRCHAGDVCHMHLKGLKLYRFLKRKENAQKQAQVDVALIKMSLIFKNRKKKSKEKNRN